MTVDRILKNLILLCLMGTIFFSCAVNPVSGRRQLMLVSENQEISMGRSVDEDLKSQYCLYEDKALQNYVHTVAGKLEPFVHRPHLEYYYYVLDTPVPNAFAAPGGYVYVTRGLLALMNSEAELAAVLGHELGHISARHSVGRLSYGIVTELLLETASVVSSDFASIRDLTGLGTQLIFLKYSRQDEYEADELAVQYTSSAGYSSREMITFFRTLERSSPADGVRVPSFLSTHPLSEQRIQRIKTLIPPDDYMMTVERNRYLRQIDGLIYGENPRQGLMQNSKYYYPNLDFQLIIPSQWDIHYSRQNIILNSKDKRGFMLWEFKTAPKSLADVHQDSVKDFKNFVIEEERKLNINRFPVYLTRGSIQIAGRQTTPEVYTLLLATIHKNGVFYKFAALVSNTVPDRLEEAQNHLFTFSPIQETHVRNIQPDRIKIHEVNDSRPLHEILQGLDYDRTLWEKTAIINNMERDSVPERNQLLKLIIQK